MEYNFNRTWADIDLDCISHNLKEIKRLIGKRTDICAVVKADAYGHGVMEVVRTLLSNGVTFLAVSMLDEAIQLRKSGITVPILVLSYTEPCRAHEIIENKITQTIFSLELAESLSAAAVSLKKNIKVHVKIDTGMARIGFMSGYSAIKSIVQISKLPRIIIEGIFTHFASADEPDKTYTQTQFEQFMSICSELNRIGIYIPIKHVSNSAGMIQFPEMNLSMVRPGISLYGLYPSSDVDKNKINLKPSMTLKSKVILAKDVDEGTFVSYGRTYKTNKKCKIATIPIGYADGYTRLLSNKGNVLVNGQFAPIIGRICMDQCMVDISNVSGEVKSGDDVVLFGRQGDNEITVEQLANDMGTINYEIICIIGKRVPRIYHQDGQICNVLNYLNPL